ncbi:adenylate/guanylate cyclase domain-containing protein [Calditrichota bacterium]
MQKNIRQLAAIMFTDMVGYTALMQEDEDKAKSNRDRHRKVLEESIKNHHGLTLQYYGDGTLSVFGSAIEAVECAVEIQTELQKEPKIPLRIGLHVGDIVYSDDGVYGDAVNIASRIENLSVSGSVLISAKVFDDIKNHKEFKTVSLGEHELKNVKQPIEVYAISNEGLVVPQKSQIKGKTSDKKENLPKSIPLARKLVLGILMIFILAVAGYFLYQNLDTGKPAKEMDSEKSIAVLPFVNMSGDPEQEYFSDGISEEILNSLANVEGLKVAGRTSAFSFKGKNEDIRTIGEKLDISMVLEGSVRKAGNQVRITAQLINVADGFHIWSETYNREMKDIFAVQEEIATRIFEKLKLQVQEASESKGGTQNMEAYELLLKGSYFFLKSYEHIEKAMGYFQKAVELDPNYAEAYAYIGELYLYYIGFLSTSDAFAKARTAAQKAISLNEFEPRAHKVLAYIHLFYDWDWEATLSEYNKSIQHGQQEQNEFITYYYIFVKKDYDRAIRISEQILETDPLRVESHWQLGMCNYFAARFEEALVSYNNALELNPNYSEALRWKGVVLAYLGKFEEAINSVEKSLEITNGQGPAKLDLLRVKILMGKKDEVLQVIKSEEFVDPVDAAELYALLEMPDEAIVWLEKGYRERSVLMISLKHFWIWDPIRDDPRFIKIYDRMNFLD